ncbi:hypothetical protein SAMN04487775_103113 [Treponema bryantii]|uniref:Lipoprotein n=1 Tax=Treponema bryantii TaxID=163 RepID=A0A1I3JLP6_9SPIR|nr:hypothetical protein [Treponema bryantii]SFI61187.1 hypothetical protein SAMN04487775_103113 [Treponema bryantii]
MKKIFVVLFGMLVAFSVISCNNPNNTQDNNTDPLNNLFGVQDVTGWDDWEDLTTGQIGSWIVGTWDYSYRGITNEDDMNYIKKMELTCTANFSGTSSSSSVVWVNSSDTSIMENHTDTLGTVKYRMDTYYADDWWETEVITPFLQRGGTVTSVDKKVWKKVNKSRTQMEFYKYIYLTGTLNGESGYLIAQANETFIKRQ